MRTRLALLGILSLSVIGLATGDGLAQGLAARTGQTLDGIGRGIKQETQNLGSAVRRRFDAVRNEVNRMGVPSRVYSRLHWDKALVSSRIEVHPVRGGSILLRGTVPDTETKNRALALASETVDVTSVIDELSVLNNTSPTSITTTPTTTTTTTIKP